MERELVLGLGGDWACCFVVVRRTFLGYEVGPLIDLLDLLLCSFDLLPRSYRFIQRGINKRLTSPPCLIPLKLHIQISRLLLRHHRPLPPLNRMLDDLHPILTNIVLLRIDNRRHMLVRRMAAGSDTRVVPGVAHENITGFVFVADH